LDVNRIISALWKSKYLETELEDAVVTQSLEDKIVGKDENA